MAGSGVMRLRLSKKANNTKRWYPAKDEISENAGPGRPKVDVNVGSGLAPKKHTPFTNYTENTKPPKGRTLPVRGEGPTRNINR